MTCVLLAAFFIVDSAEQVCVENETRTAVLVAKHAEKSTQSVTKDIMKKYR